MITGDIKSQIDRIWDAFWSGGISDPPFAGSLDYENTAKALSATQQTSLTQLDALFASFQYRAFRGEL